MGKTIGSGMNHNNYLWNGLIEVFYCIVVILLGFCFNYIIYVFLTIHIHILGEEIHGNPI